MHNGHTSKPLIKIFFEAFFQRTTILALLCHPQQSGKLCPIRRQRRWMPRTQGLLKTAATHLAAGGSWSCLRCWSAGLEYHYQLWPGEERSFCCCLGDEGSFVSGFVSALQNPVWPAICGKGFLLWTSYYFKWLSNATVFILSENIPAPYEKYLCNSSVMHWASLFILNSTALITTCIISIHKCYQYFVISILYAVQDHIFHS